MNLRDAWVLPFIKAVPYVLSKPDGKRLPKGMNFGRWRKGSTTLETFCREWSALCDEFPSIVSNEDIAIVDECFKLLSKKQEEMMSLEGQIGGGLK